MNGRTGGKTNIGRDHNQNVRFHTKNAIELAEYLLPHYSVLGGEINILDACAGDGVLGNAINIELKKHIGIDANVSFIDELYGHDVFDENGEYDLIICNPPWAIKQSLPIYNHLLSLLSQDGILIFIINNVFVYQGSDRAESLKYQKYYFLPRWTFKPAGRPLLDCGVMVYHENGQVPEDAAQLRPYIPLTRVNERIFLNESIR
jgi:hypothetical protein